MKGFINAIAIIFFAQAAVAQAPKKKEILPADVQIRVAVLAAPKEFRDSATVLGYTPEGKLTVLRQGTNDMICLGPNPKQAGVYVYAYPKRLDPFMARGRELADEGKNIKQKDEIREAEIKAGKLSFPQDPTVLYGYWGKDEDLNPATGEIKDGLRRYVIYVPHATGASTGLPTAPNLPGMPWLMGAGTYKAHIMVNPANMGHSH
ncbi:hypothetical protein [Chitinophaga sp. sic0106]|uniref:hypothetical protein n=1 Tax=Chitinophaga sp. sic0106 TaxID=2854785 RepID=UPI001C4926E0|nr:hypothetical protein [Chitinophaga sp. sic0106]MBV7533075.1 hypothetical protein [Chitinophaga sp. sic0106]